MVRWYDVHSTMVRYVAVKQVQSYPALCHEGKWQRTRLLFFILLQSSSVSDTCNSLQLRTKVDNGTSE